jgi:hypothetical protein
MVGWLPEGEGMVGWLPEGEGIKRIKEVGSD